MKSLTFWLAAIAILGLSLGPWMAAAIGTSGSPMPTINFVLVMVGLPAIGIPLLVARDMAVHSGRLVWAKPHPDCSPITSRNPILRYGLVSWAFISLSAGSLLFSERGTQGWVVTLCIGAGMLVGLFASVVLLKPRRGE